jgi:hypothetical protein
MFTVGYAFPKKRIFLVKEGGNELNIRCLSPKMLIIALRANRFILLS